MSAKFPISSVIAAEGVSGEIATPAFMSFPWMVLIREIASAGRTIVRISTMDRRSMDGLTGCLYVKTVEFTAGT
jgi:hypothetical protein